MYDQLKDHTRNKHLDKATKAKVVQAIQSFNGYKDLNCLRSWLLFSGNQAATLAEFYTKHMYNSIRRSDYPTADDYLKGLEIESQPFQTLLPPHLGNPKTLLILDPPYVSTLQGMYANNRYFGMVQFLQLMDMVRPPFILFGSTRSELLSYLSYVRDFRPDEWPRFNGFKTESLTVNIGRGVAEYEDNMVWKF
ncbi:hypothetical protein [Bergeriella denitrificans]|uniref:hypothetical protein n=1 Tax=Bergeriella denitrificans TaxID=494 RepID=UPI0012E76F98|nr:hypothetical protein [Bergeriella denitrificans]